MLLSAHPRLSSTLISLFDLSISFALLFCHNGTFSFSSIVDQIIQFSVFTSTLDLFLISVIRMLIWHSPKFLNAASATYAYATQKPIEHFITCVIMSMYAYSFAKLLLLVEPLKEGETLGTGEIIFLIWNFIGTIMMHVLSKFVYPQKAESYEQLQEEDEDVAYELSKPADRLKARQVISRYMEYVKADWLSNAIGTSSLFVYAIFKILIPYYLGKMVTEFVATKSYDVLHRSVLTLLVLSLIAGLADAIRSSSLTIAFNQISRRIRHDLYSSLLRQEVAFYDLNKTGIIVSRLASDTETMSLAVSWYITHFFKHGMILVGSMIFMCFLSWRLGMVTFILAPTMWFATDIIGAMYDKVDERLNAKAAIASNAAQEAISSMRTVRSFAGEEDEIARYYFKLTDAMNVHKIKSYLSASYHCAEEISTRLCMLGVMWYGGHLVLSGKMNSDLLLGFLVYQLQLGNCMQEMMDVITGLMQVVGTSRKVFEYIDREPLIQTSGTLKPENLQGAIEFRDVHFTYPTRMQNPVLKGISFNVYPGEVVALVGPSGSGKSSCIALLERFYEANSGQILIDGQPVAAYDHSYLHEKIALVGQEPVLFGRSIADNIIYGIEGKTETDIVNASVQANAHNFILEQPEKYETNAGERGSQISGGQKQRIAIARALVRNPTILLLDEATSALDTESEKLVQEALQTNLSGRTVLLVAHRLSTVEKADRIIVLNKGEIIESGTHMQLLMRDGVYANLVRRQLVGQQNEVSPIDKIMRKSSPKASIVNKRRKEYGFISI